MKSGFFTAGLKKVLLLRLRIPKAPTMGRRPEILAYWSDEAVYLLCRDRKGEHCVEPKAGLLENPVW